MFVRFLFVIIFLSILSAFSIIQVIDLDDQNYKNLCYEVTSVGNCTTSKIKFDKEDELLLVSSSKTLWSSEKNHILLNLIVLSSSDKVELVNILFEDTQKHELVNIYFCNGDEGFKTIESDLYHNIASVLRNDSRNFDVNSVYGDWFMTTNKENHKIHRIDQSVKVSKVVDRLKVIWKNEFNFTVSGVKVRLDDMGEPEYCEILCYEKSDQYKFCYMKDDFGWHHINTIKTPVVTSKIKTKSGDQFQITRPTDESEHVNVNIATEDVDEVQEIIQHYKPSVLLVSLSDDPHTLTPEGMDIGDYTICGMKSRVYNAYRAGVSHVTDGSNILWVMKSNHYLHKVSLYRSHDKNHILVEIEFMVKTDYPMNVVEGLKPKHRFNNYYVDYKHLIKTSGKWEECTRTYFLHFLQNLVRTYMIKNRHLRFDGSFGNFFENVYLPPMELKIRRNITYKSFKSFAKSFLDRIISEYVPIAYDLNDNPFYIFEARHHYFFPDFQMYKIKRPYALFRLMDGDQIIWNQTENGLGCKQIFYLKLADEAFLHLEIDSEQEPRKYYHMRNSTWIEVEEEEHMSLINIKAKQFLGNTFLYKDETYIVNETEDNEGKTNKGFSDSPV